MLGISYHHDIKMEYFIKYQQLNKFNILVHHKYTISLIIVYVHTNYYICLVKVAPLTKIARKPIWQMFLSGLLSFSKI